MVWCTDSGGSAQLGFVDVVDLRSLQTGQNIQCGGRAYRQTSLVDRLSDYQSSKSRCSVVCVRTSLPTTAIQVRHNRSCCEKSEHKSGSKDEEEVTKKSKAKPLTPRYAQNVASEAQPRQYAATPLNLESNSLICQTDGVSNLCALWLGLAS
jgi:hypothetical protein